jgi:type I restriction enzyme M protein
MTKKFTQQEVNNILWGACDTFRKTIDSSVYKDYILVMLFVKYVSDIYKEHYEVLLQKYDGDREMADRQIKLDRFHLNSHATFDFLYENRNASNVGETINKALADIEEENKTKLRGVFKNIDFNSESILGATKGRNAMLKDLLDDFQKLDLRPSRLDGEDIIGNAYEYLISNFASDAGKKGGEFFTPSAVSELLSSLVKPQENDRIYDPTCGSGSLLIKAFNKVPSKKVQIYGQESKGQNHSLARMNMFLHGIDDAKIAWGDTLANPLHLENDKLMKFQVVVANPPFSLDKWASGFSGESNGDFKMEASLDPYKRFDWGVPPKSKGDYAFVLHMLHSLSEEGRMAVVLPHGVLFRGGSEGKIRKQIVNMNLLDAVIGLPTNLFFGTGIPAVILVFKQNRTTKDVLFIDASQEEMFERGKNQNRLRPEDIQNIIDIYENYHTIDKVSVVVSLKEIKDNEFNLNITRYVDTFEEEQEIDLDSLKTNIINIKKELHEVEEQMKKYLEELGL